MPRKGKKPVETPIYTIQPFLEEDLWAQCDHESCQKWRRLPKGTQVDDKSKWYCEMNPDKKHNNCSVPEEVWPEVSPDFHAIFDPKLIAQFHEATLQGHTQTKRNNKSSKQSKNSNSLNKLSGNKKRLNKNGSSQIKKASVEDQSYEEEVKEKFREPAPKVKRQKVIESEEIKVTQQKSLQEEEKLVADFFMQVAKCNTPMELWSWNGFADTLQILHKYEKDLTQEISSSLQQWQAVASMQQVGPQVDKSCALFKQIVTVVVTACMEQIYKLQGNKPSQFQGSRRQMSQQNGNTMQNMEVQQDIDFEQPTPKRQKIDPLSQSPFQFDTSPSINKGQPHGPQLGINNPWPQISSNSYSHMQPSLFSSLPYPPPLPPHLPPLNLDTRNPPPPTNPSSLQPQISQILDLFHATGNNKSNNQIKQSNNIYHNNYNSSNNFQLNNTGSVSNKNVYQRRNSGLSGQGSQRGRGNTQNVIQMLTRGWGQPLPDLQPQPQPQPQLQLSQLLQQQQQQQQQQQLSQKQQQQQQELLGGGVPPSQTLCELISRFQNSDQQSRQNEGQFQRDQQQQQQFQQQQQQ